MDINAVVELLQNGPAVEGEALFENLYDLSDDDKALILSEQNDRFNASMRYMEPLQTQMIKNYKMYRSIAEPLKDDLGRAINNRANIYVPYPWAIVESAMPRLAGRLPRVHAFPRKAVEKDKVSAIQDLILYGLDRMGFLKLQQLWIRQFEIYGWSPLIYFWRNETRSVFERKPSMHGGYEMVKSPKVVWDDFSARVIDVFDAFLQPGVESVEDGDWFIFREWMSKKDIKARVDGETFYPEVMDYIRDNKTSGGATNAGDQKQDKDAFGGLIKDFQKHSFGRYEVRYTLENNRIIVTIDGKCIARVGDNPHPLQEKALINLNLLPLVNEPIGISTIESLGGLPDKLNALTNARLDNISLLMNKVFIANRNSNTDFDNIIFSPGNVILTDDPQTCIRELEIEDTGQSSERETLTTKEELQFTSGISDYIVGVNGSSRLSSTATGVSSIIRESNARFSLKLAAFESTALRKLVEAIHVYNMMYMPEEKRIHVLGPKGYIVKDIKLDEILTECDFIIEPGSSAPLDQLSRREALTSLLDRVIQLPQVVDIGKFMKEVLESYDIRNIDNMLISVNTELPEYQDIALAEAENIAILQGQEIELKGNDALHLKVHDKALGEITAPEALASLNAHIALHSQRQQTTLMASQQAGQNSLFGGANAPAGGIGGQQQSPGGPTGQSQPPQQLLQSAPSGAAGLPTVGGGVGVV